MNVHTYVQYILRGTTFGASAIVVVVAIVTTAAAAATSNTIAVVVAVHCKAENQKKG